MTSIIYVGMDVHTTNYTLCCYSMADDRFFAEVQVEPDAKNILKYLARIEKQQNKECRIVCGYEAGCLGYSLYHQLHAHGVDCVILAPTTMMTTPGKRIKTDRRDACLISKCLAFHTYSPVYIPTEMDDAVKGYIRMRDDANSALVRVKQQIITFCIRYGEIYDGKSYWTNKHLDWLSNLNFGNDILSEVLQEYLIRYYQLREQVDMYDTAWFTLYVLISVRRKSKLFDDLKSGCPVAKSWPAVSGWVPMWKERDKTAAATSLYSKVQRWQDIEKNIVTIPGPVI